MIITVAEGFPKLNATPLASLFCNAPEIVVEVDDVNEARIRLIFSPYQAIKMVTTDCFNLPDGMSIIPRTVMEIHDSDWLNELRNTLKITDCDADFMDKSRHFLLPLEDSFLEVVAWEVEITSVD